MSSALIADRAAPERLRSKLAWFAKITLTPEHPAGIFHHL
jgi:hypothetical protein